MKYENTEKGRNELISFQAMILRIKRLFKDINNKSTYIFCKDIPGFWEFFKSHPDRLSNLRNNGYSLKKEFNGWVVYSLNLIEKEEYHRISKVKDFELPVPKHVRETLYKKQVSQTYLKENS